MFEIWMFYVIFSAIAVIIEIFTQKFFFINFAFAGIITALISIFWGDWVVSGAIFIALSIISILFLKPILIKCLKNSENEDFSEKYIGKIVKADEEITQNSGVITIYEEKWQARIKEGSTIEKGADVKIIDNEKLILLVEKV